MWCLSRSGTLYFNDEIFGLPGFIIRITAESWPFREGEIITETTRSPFDLVEAESELVGGWATEYPGISFSLFFMAEYCNVMLLSSLASIYFFSTRWEEVG